MSRLKGVCFIGPRTISACLLAIALACSLAALTAQPAAAQTILQSDFEDGTLQGWGPFGGPTLTNSTDVAHGGTHSLLTTNRTAGFNGPSHNMLGLLVNSATYQITAWVRLTTGEAPTQLRMTMLRTVNGSNNFDSIGQTSATGVTDSAWTQVTGLYAFGGTDPSGLTMYVESASATESYYIDDVTVVKIADPPGPPPNTNGLTSTFETGTTEGWMSRTGTETVAASQADAHSGAFSLLTTGRTATYQGPNFDVTNIMFNGSQYKVSIWAKLAPGESPTQLRVSLQRNAGTITTFHTVVGNTNVTADAWVRLTTTYNVALANSSLFLYVESASGTPSFYIDDVQITYIPPPVIEQNIPSVFQTLAPFFPVGVAVTPLEITGVHAQLLTKHFNSITSGNDMKWDATEPQEGNFQFTNADAELSFAQANNIIMRGHTLLWHQQIPSWVFIDPSTGQTMLPSDANKALLTQRLINHINGVAGHFAGKLYAWDVVNEVIDESQSDCLRRSTWYNIIGPSYIDIAFQTARQVDPNALLFINDFNSTVEPKRTCLYNLVAGLKSRNIPVDGVGHQMHNNLEFPPVQGLIDTVNLFAGLGVTQHITEMDENIYTGSNNTSIANYDEIPPDRFVTEGYQYRDFFQAYRQLAGKITSVTLWGLADDNTWLNQSGRINAPLLFDPQLQHKLAYTGIIDPLDLPGADIATALSASTNTVLSGQTLVYTITVTNNGHDDAASLSLVDTIPQGTTFQSLTGPGDWTCTTPAVGGTGQISCTAPALANGASAQFLLTVAVPCGAVTGTAIANTATASSTTLDPNPAPNNTASVNVVVSNPPPTISGLSVNRPVLFPPFHQFVKETLTYSIGDNCDVGLAGVVTVTMNQNDVHHGHPDIDWFVLDPFHVLLQAEVDPPSHAGRTYTITVTTTDSVGQSTSSSVNVLVPGSRH